MTAVFVCSCGRRSGDSWLEKVTAGLGADHVVGSDNLCGAAGLKLLRDRAKKSDAGRILLAGCPALETEAYRRAAATAAGLAPGDVSTVVLPSKASAPAAVRTVSLARAALDMTPVFDTRSVPLGQDVLVVGRGPAADEAARLVRGFGHTATVIDAHGLPTLEGAVGSFRVADRSFGAVVIAAGLEQRSHSSAPFVPGRIVPLGSLESHLASLHRRDRPRSVVLLLDLEIDETKASWSAAVRTCPGGPRRLQDRGDNTAARCARGRQGPGEAVRRCARCGHRVRQVRGKADVSVTADGVSIALPGQRGRRGRPDRRQRLAES